MFNLEQAIDKWRQQVLASGLKSPEILDELESHLRDDITTAVSNGTSEQLAFDAAVRRMGNTGLLKTEFAKVEPTYSWPVILGIALWICSICILLGGLSPRLASGKVTPLLFIHIVSLTAGYGAVLVNGLLGIYFVCSRTSKAFSASHEKKFQRSVHRFNQIAAALVLFGIACGMLWGKHQTGSYFEPANRSIGPLCVGTWVLGLCLYQWLSRPNVRNAMLLAVSGNIVVSVAWFGSFVFYSAKGSLLLAGLIAVHTAFLALDLTRKPVKAVV